MRKSLKITSVISAFFLALLPFLSLGSANENAILRDSASNLSKAQYRYVYIKELGDSLAVFPTVFSPALLVNQSMHRYLSRQDLNWVKDALDLGTGTGVLALIVLKKGAKRIVATDINPDAVKNAAYNASRLGYAKVFDARPVNLNNPSAFSAINDNEKFDLIICNPPWNNARPKNIAEYAIFDDGHRFLTSIIEGLALHLRPQGKAWLELGEKDAISLCFKEAAQHNLKATPLLTAGPSYAIIELNLRGRSPLRGLRPLQDQYRENR